MTEEQFNEIVALKKEYEERQQVYQFAVQKEKDFVTYNGRFYEFNLLSIDRETASSLLAAYTLKMRKIANEAERKYIEALNRFENHEDHQYGIGED